MRNFFYKKDNGDVIVGVSVADTAQEIAQIVPKGKKFYFYTDIMKLNEIQANTPAGIGTSPIPID